MAELSGRSKYGKVVGTLRSTYNQVIFSSNQNPLTQLADNQLNINIGTAFSEVHSEWAVKTLFGFYMKLFLQSVKNKGVWILRIQTPLF
jgi:hypothetical protein